MKAFIYRAALGLDLRAAEVPAIVRFNLLSMALGSSPRVTRWMGP
jgi:hypothetical protein